MTLLNYLFGNKEDIAKKLIVEDNKRILLWNEHLKNHETRQQLAKHFNYENLDAAVKNFSETRNILIQMEALISPELITIFNEEKNDKQIIANLKKLKSTDEIDKLSAIAVSVKQKEKVLLEMFNEILNVLKAELHLIQLIKKNPTNLKDLLKKLFEIIFFNETRLYKVFKEKNFFDESMEMHKQIVKIAKAIILEQEIKEEEEAEEEKFAKEMAIHMPEGSKHKYRKLAEDIFDLLAEMAGAPMSDYEDITEGIRKMEGFIRNDEVMKKIVKKLRPKDDEVKQKAIIMAFRIAHNSGHFIELESQFAT